MRIEDLIGGDKNLYCVDLSWLMYKSYYGYKDLSVDIEGYKRPTGHLYGVTKAIININKSDSNCIIAICQDGVPVERNALMEEAGLEYKADREAPEFNFYKDVPLLKALLCSIPNVVWVYDEDKESDDEMYALARQAEASPNWQGRVYIYSGDNDLLQSITDTVSVIRKFDIDKNKFEVINEEVVTTDEKFTKKFHGVDPAHLPYFRAIVGDSSDKIPGIYPRFPRDIAKKVAMNMPAMYLPSNPKEVKWVKIFEDNYDAYERNLKLMKLNVYEPTLTKPVPNKEAVDKIIEKFQVYSFKRYLEDIKEDN